MIENYILFMWTKLIEMVKNTLKKVIKAADKINTEINIPNSKTKRNPLSGLERNHLRLKDFQKTLKSLLFKMTIVFLYGRYILKNLF